MSTSKRKDEHIRICLHDNVESSRSNGFEWYEFSHNALPEIKWEDIDTSTAFLGKRLFAPLFIEAMTGGTAESERINKNLAEAAQELGIGMGVGSQRAMIETPELKDTYDVRGVAPDIFLAGNIGASHILKYPVEKIEKALNAIGADALAIHLNPAQEIAQENGDRNFSGVLEKIKAITRDLKKPVIVKEVGSGISADVARRLAAAGVDAIDIAGVGGTSWIKVDSMIGRTPYAEFYGWGIPTAESLESCRKAVRTPLIASGGIRTGIEVAKALSMGASLAGMALPLLKAANRSSDDVINLLEQVIIELKSVMFLTSSKKITDLRNKAVKI
ncbi:MAG: type 2 isopentenyl-diphosphate Delta-isomerase [Candidatus Aenigmarchaeota archaeon]|nr:type 2 isopentenyl-diphosphate Delta-isomerase [Candidatus Aenigmarchaeota archaeon]